MEVNMKNQIQYYKNKLEYEIDSWDLSDGIKNGMNIIVIDTRSKEAYEKEHIIGAINLPHKIMDENTSRNLDKSALIVTYCDGIGCNASTKGAYKMSLLNFNVRELIGGIDWWKRDGYQTEGSGVDSDFTEAPKLCGC
jgi:rhodanese-related sulfurtransferase